MSYPYPQDRTRDKRTKGEEPYEDAREAFGQSVAEIEQTAPEGPERRAARSDEDQARDAEERFEQIGDDVARDRDEGQES